MVSVVLLLFPDFPMSGLAFYWPMSLVLVAMIRPDISMVDNIGLMPERGIGICSCFKPIIYKILVNDFFIFFAFC